MLKTTSLTWHSPLRFGDTAQLHCSVSRWGNSSFDVLVSGRVDDEPRFDCTITYVSIDPESQRPAPIPDFVKDALSR
jgi:acyl-CoA thioesterase FadM